MFYKTKYFHGVFSEWDPIGSNAIPPTDKVDVELLPRMSTGILLHIPWDCWEKADRFERCLKVDFEPIFPTFLALRADVAKAIDRESDIGINREATKRQQIVQAMGYAMFVSLFFVLKLGFIP